VANHSRAQMIRAFAEASGLKLRSAQWNAKLETEKWREFVATAEGRVRAAGEELVLEPKRGPVDPAGPVSMDLPPIMGDPVEMERRHWELWQEASRQALAATRGQQAMLAAGFTKLSCEARKSYIEARRARVQAQLESRELLSRAEYEELLTRAQVVAGLIERAFTDIASEANPEAPILVIRAGSKWLERKFNPAVEELATAA